MARKPLYASTATAGTPVDPFVQNMISSNGEAPSGQTQRSFPQLDRGPQSVHTGDLFFDNSAAMYARGGPASLSANSSSMSTQLYPYHQQALRHQYPSHPQPAQNPYLQKSQYGYGEQQRPWEAPPIAPPPNQPNRPSALTAGHHSFSARPSTSYAPSQSQGSQSSFGPRSNYPPYRTQSLFGQTGPQLPPAPPPPLPTSQIPRPPMHSPPTQSNPYMNSPPPPTGYNRPPQAPYNPQASNPYIGSNQSPPIPYAVQTPESIVPPPQPTSLPPKVEEEEEVPPSPESDPEELAMAIAMSETESNQRRLMEEKLISQEEDDLARALAESMRTSESRTPVSTPSYPSGPSASSSKQRVASPDRSAIRVDTNGYNSPPRENLATPTAHAPPISSAYSDDSFDFGLGNYRRWQAPGAGSSSQAGRSSSTPRPNGKQQAHSRQSSVSSGSSLPYTLPSAEQDGAGPLPEYVPTSARLASSLAAMESLQKTDTDESKLVFDDEAYARQLASEEEQELAQLIDRKAKMEADRERQYEDSLPPQYSTEGVMRPETRSEDSHSSAAGPSSSPASSVSSSLPSPAFPSSPVQSHRPIMPSLTSFASTSTSSSSSTSYSDAHSTHSNQSSPNMAIQPQRPHSNSASASAGPSRSSASSSSGLLNPNHFVDKELLMGVSIGFRPPAILPRLVLMEETMPNIISLPATKCPPLHLQAPDWQHLLRLMARLSNTRIEPTVEAMAAGKVELKLRTVIQFVKPRANVNAWRTILWFTIDNPVPPTVQNASRYLTSNPNLLPFSYTQNPVPALLKAASDTPSSKTFTIPESDAVPLPTLPITFPNLALYLHAALQESRKYVRSSDASTGFGKLGKMVQMCYPNVKVEEQDDDFSGRSSAVSGLFKKVMGRSNKDKRRGKTTNEETYQLVTPFVPDEWG